MNEAIDYSTVKWVKQELDATLKQARQALEAYVEMPADEAQLRFCAVHLHQVHGTLQMVELYGAALLAEEMEQVVEALMADAVGQREEAYELVMRGILQLPDYLERLIAGYRDIPLVLLPLLNDLRAIRGQKLLSENSLFTPDLSAKLPADVGAASSGEDLRMVARKQRHPYQLALLGWFRGKDPEGNLDRLCQVLVALRLASTTDRVRCLWWVTEGLVTALRNGWLDTSMATKLLLGQTDRQIKRLIDEDEAELASDAPLDLIKNVLFYVARARDGGDPVTQIKNVYRLGTLLPEQSELEQAAASLSGHNTELMATVSAAIKEDLARVKDAVDLFQRGGSTVLTSLQPVAETLGQVADTLGMLGLGALRKTAQAQADAATDMVEGRREADERALMDIAAALLCIESSLDAHATGRGTPPIVPDEMDEQVVPDAEFSQVRVVVADEAIRDIAQAKDAVLAVMDDGSDFSLLEKVPQLFHQISGGLLLLGEQRAAGIVDALCSYVADRMLAQRSLPDQQAFESLADAVSSVEYYLEGLREDRLFGQSILDSASRALEQLGCGPGLTVDTSQQVVADQAPKSAAREPVAPETIDYDVDEVLAEPEVVEIEAQGDVENEVDDSVAEIDAIELADPYSEPSPLTVEITVPDQAEGSGSSREASGPAASDISVAPVAASTALQALSEDIDPEILEIFIEESEEELANIKEFLPRWMSDAEDRDALTDMRRSFHTLKGSGRLVGAMRIGEFAWAFENMLNRVIDGTVVRSPAICTLLDRAARALPELIAQIRDGTATSEPVEALAEFAQACSRGEALSLGGLGATASVPAGEEAAPFADEEGTATPETPPVEDAAQAVPSEPGIDPVLYDIFSNESRDHVSTVQVFLEACKSSDEECHVTDALLRALHTLHGSARMAGADAVADVANAIEKYAKALRKDDLPLPAEGAGVIGQAMDIIGGLVARLRQADPADSAHESVIELLDDLTHRADSQAADGVPPPVVEPAVGVEDDVDGPLAIDDHGLEVEEIEVREFESPAVDIVDVESPESGLGQNGFDMVDEPDPTASSVQAPFSGDAGDWSSVDPEVIEEIDLAGTESGPAPQDAGSLNQVAVGPGDAVPGGEEPSAVAYDAADQDLIDVFLEEGEEILAASDAALHKWVDAPADQSLMAELQRHLHTLKGGARMAGIGAIGDLSHALESLLIAVVDGLVAPGTALFDVLLVAQDRLVHMLEAVRDRRPLQAATGVIDQLEALRRGQSPAAAAPAEVLPEVAPELVPTPVSEPVQTTRPHAAGVSAEGVASEAPADEQVTMARSQQELVRVRADLLDNMVNFAGEISIYRSRLEQQVGSMRFNLSELGQTVERIREQLRKLEIETEAQVLFRYERDVASADEQFDPLEMDRYSHLQQLSRSMLESISDLVSIQGLMDNITRESETLLLQQSRVNTELQEGLMRTRMVPFAGLAPRMRRIVRQAALELGKRAELMLEGADGEMDRTVIDRIIAPLEHMLRNAVAHGIEMPEQRAAVGKKPAGAIRVSLSRDGSEVVIQLSDDGAGMNIAAIRRKARERGLIADGAEVSDSDVMQFVLETGFSTAEQVSQIAGRGVGMDVVNSEVKQLGGSLHIDSKQGVGTTFTIRLPFTLAISQALLVQVHEEVYAIPLTGIEGIVRMRGEELSRYLHDSGARFEYAGHSYPIHNLGELLGHGAAVVGTATPKRLPVLLVRSGDHRMALQVEGLLGSRETVVKSVGPQISSVRGISGATILGDGRVVLILDLGGLLRSGGVSATLDHVPAEPVQSEERPLLAMVVDDSITVRKVTTRLLERNGMQVITAKDGVDAVAKLQEHLPDVMLLDIEMPRMDGFELATHVRNEARLRAIPIIMITSRTGDKHRRRAMEIGVDRYLGKPFQESELLETIRALAKERSVDG